MADGWPGGEPSPRWEPEPEPEQVGVPQLGLPAMHGGDEQLFGGEQRRDSLASAARSRSAAAFVSQARDHMAAAATADQHNMGGPQYALAIQSLERALRIDAEAEMDGRHAALVLQEVNERLGQREQERNEATVAAATASAAGGLLERAVGSATSWLQLSGWTGGSLFDAPEPCEMAMPPAAPVRGHLSVTSTAIEFDRLANPAAERPTPAPSSFKRLWNSSGGGAKGSGGGVKGNGGGVKGAKGVVANGGHTLSISLAKVVNCFERREASPPPPEGGGALPPPIAPPAVLGGSDVEGLACDGYVEAPEEQRTVVVAYTAGLEGSAMQLEASLTLSASAAESLLTMLEPIVERFHATRRDGGSVASGAGTSTVYERVYLQCEIDGQSSLDSGALQLNQTERSRGAGCTISFEASFHSLSIRLGADASGAAPGELLLAHVREDVPEIRGRQTVHVVHQPAGAEDSHTVEWLLEPEEAAALVEQLKMYIGPVAELQERFTRGAALRAHAKETAAEVAELLETVPPVLTLAQRHGEAGRYAMASAMLTLELLKMHRVVEEWRSLGGEASSSSLDGQLSLGLSSGEFEYESTEEKAFEALGYLFGNCGTVEAHFSQQGRHRMQVWGMLSNQNSFVGDVWLTGFYVLEGCVVSCYRPWDADPASTFVLQSVTTLSRVVSTPKSTFEVVATLGLDGTKNEMPEHVMSVRLQQQIQTATEALDDVVGAAASLLMGQDLPEDIGNGSADVERSVGVGRELTDRTNELFARVSEEGDWSAESRAEAMRLSQSHLEYGDLNAASAAGADRYGLGGPQWALAADAFRNALRLRPSDNRWADAEDGAAAEALVEAEAGAVAAAEAAGTGGAPVSGAPPTAIEHVLRAPDAASFDIWETALTPISNDVFAVQSFPMGPEGMKLHLYKVDATGGGGRGHWGGGGAAVSPSKGPRPPREDRGWTTRHCRLFPSAICLHEEGSAQLGQPVDGAIDLWQIVKASVHVVPSVSAPREHYGRVGTVLSMVVVVPPTDDGEGNFESGSVREVCLASSDQVLIEQWKQSVLDQLEKRSELPADPPPAPDAVTAPPAPPPVTAPALEWDGSELVE